MKDELDLTLYTPKPPATMVEGKAIGGPRDGIKLTASRSWDGIVMENLVRAYNGKYKWNEHNWVWQDEPVNTHGTSRARGLAHHKRRKDAFAH